MLASLAAGPLIDSGLEDVSISRENQAWGIPFPTDPSRPEKPGAR